MSRMEHQIPVRVDDELHTALVIDAGRNGRTVAQSVRFHLRRALAVAQDATSGEVGQ